MHEPPMNAVPAPCHYRGPVRMLLISTYELGHQPLHVASPAGAPIRAGHDVRCLDLSVEPFDAEAVRWADAAACSVPMHTACRLALAACARSTPWILKCLYACTASTLTWPPRRPKIHS